MTKVSTDILIDCVLYAVAEKKKIGLDMGESIKRAKQELLHAWNSDMAEIEKDATENGQLIEKIRN